MFGIAEDKIADFDDEIAAGLEPFHVVRPPMHQLSALRPVRRPVVNPSARVAHAMREQVLDEIGAKA